MRIRNIKNAKEKISHNDLVIIDPKKYKGNWHSLFNNDNPIMIEIGMGKGTFIKEMALRHKEYNFIGIDRYDSIVLRAYEKIMDGSIPNLKLALFDADILLEVFDKNEIERIYLNFSDPWPKNSHAKRRLTHANYLKRYEVICGKEIHFKTDNIHLFEFSLESMNNYGLLFKNISLNLHNSNYENNIETEYEQKFKEFGPIYRLEAYFKNDNEIDRN